MSPVESSYSKAVQRSTWEKNLAPRRRFVMDPARIAPFVRIAHHPQHGIDTGERIILDHELVLIEHGQGELHWLSQGRRRRNCVRLIPGKVMLIPPFQPHHFKLYPPCAHWAIHFDFAWDVPTDDGKPDQRTAYSVSFPRGLTLPPVTLISPDDKLAAQIKQIATHHTSSHPMAAMRTASTLTRVLLQLFTLELEHKTPSGADKSQHGEELPEPPRALTDHADVAAGARVKLERAVDKIHTNYAQTLSAAGLARIAGMSTTHFNRLFKQWTGQSPMAYLRDYRIMRAKQLMADVDLSIKQIALQVGFDDPYHFSRVFRQIDGLSPRDYRSALLAQTGRSRENTDL